MQHWRIVLFGLYIVHQVPLYCEGLELTLSGIALEGTHVKTTDIGQSSESGLVCSFTSSQYLNKFGWDHKLTLNQSGDRELGKKGWSSESGHLNGRQWLILFRTPGSRAVEGIFTCNTNEGSVSVNISHSKNAWRRIC
ncbi:hypothetical protein GBAR_LOCUS12951 [Geodia barretti]|uniref:Uncharacterized protein n=1 Tax=Geodia barretti TaxID=519541 RepID=A0AA35S302_GEOBA|nr:hypothetical protein GBAR_LOCUS12951 [Geodia barretti]